MTTQKSKNNVLITIYIVLTLILALTVALLSLRFGIDQPFLYRDIALFILIATLAEGYDLVLSRSYTVSAHPAIHIALIFLLPPPAVILITFVSITTEQVVNKYAWYKAAFNIAHHVIIVGFPTLVVAIGGRWTDIRQVQSHQEILFTITPVIILYYLLDIALVDLVIALSTGNSFLQLWLSINRNTVLFDLTLPAIGLIMAVLWLQSPFLCLLLPLPIAVNRFALNILKRLESEAKQLQDTLKQLESKLRVEEDTARQILILANQLYEVSLAQSIGSQRQTQAVTKAVASLVGLSATAAALASNAEQGVHLTEQISANTGKVRGNVGNTIQIISTIETRIGNISSSVGDLNSQIDRIRQVAVIMRQLADEVRLLSLNATIEAAGAGVYGRRFSVVAQEVRSLAEASQVSATQVAHLVSEVQNSGRLTLLVSETSAQEAESSVQAAQEAIYDNLQILTGIEQIAELMEQTSHKTQHQQVSSRQILELMQEIEQVTQQSASSAQKIETVVAELKEAAGTLNHVLGT